MDVSTPPSLDLACPQPEDKIEKYVHMFRDRGVDKNKIRTRDDVGRNPMVTIFHVWTGSYGESRRTRGRTRGKTQGEREKSLNRHGINHTSARSPKA